MQWNLSVSLPPARPGFSTADEMLNHCHLSFLRRILHIRWQDKIPDSEVIDRGGIPEAASQKAKFRWPAISPECLKIAATVYRTLSEQALGLAGAEETFQILPHTYGVPQRPGNQKTSNWESQAKDRPTWRRKVPTGATVRQKNDGPQQKHRSRKRAAQSCSTTHSCLMGSDWPHYLCFDSPPPVFSLRLWSSSTFERGTTLFSF